MIHNSLELHNVVELTENEGMSGLQMHRIPQRVRDTLNARGRWNSQGAPGSEIRFVTTADHVRLFISTVEGDGDLLAMRGDMLLSIHHVEAGQVLCVHVEPPERFGQVKPEAFAGARFSPDVWRFMTAGFFPVLHRVETFGHEIRPPRDSEKPSLTWLAYGSSITAGSGASRPHTCYVQQAARRLGVDVLNLAMGGACMCEHELADFMAERGGWDFVTLEIGVNMRGVFSPDEFRERAGYMIDTIMRKNPGKPVILITPFVNFIDYELTESLACKHQRAYEDFLRETAAKHKDNHVHLIEGRDMLADMTALCADLVHPSDYGNIVMGENLAKRLAEILQAY
jgi:lysophospholipase L1-like esterase